MGAVTIRFYAELNDHLPPESRFQTLERRFDAPGSVKDLIESFGVPHIEVELVVVNGVSVDLSYVVRDGDRAAVYPMFEAVDVTPVLRVRPAPLRDPRFVLDVHLGKLAAYLRMLGFDTFYRNCFDDADLVRVSVAERRILLTRDRGLLKHGALTHGYWVRETDSRRQLAEILRHFELKTHIRAFTRCMACNGLLSDIAKGEAIARVPARVAEAFDEFRRCGTCGRVYWRGSHHRRMQQWIESF
jgi:uncharacterized protein